jgi:hypothetical protein
MSTDPGSQQPPDDDAEEAVVEEVPATIHEAERAPGPSGAVLWGAAIDFDGAVARRKLGQDVVVRGNDVEVNRRLALKIESAVGPAKRAAPHSLLAGPLALPHFQQVTAPPTGHTFYETDKRKARRKR